MFVTSAASLQLTRSISPFARRLTGSHAGLLNRETSRICTELGVPMMHLDAANDLTSRTYATWGRRIAAHVVGALVAEGRWGASAS